MIKAIYEFNRFKNVYQIKEEGDGSPIATVELEFGVGIRHEDALNNARKKVLKLVDGWNGVEKQPFGKKVPKRLGLILKNILEKSDVDAYFQNVVVEDIRLTDGSKFRTKFKHKYSLPNCVESINIDLSEVIANSHTI